MTKSSNIVSNPTLCQFIQNRGNVERLISIIARILLTPNYVNRNFRVLLQYLQHKKLKILIKLIVEL